ncbi:uncharacterized protein PHACADRAFT_203246 [Phanerochaete carnosa HHB-10118-sp]|uniref:Uncharacterized protein n=1 Tax=Phanerochaete carnosa (strain HHB-10118-sp) TaxID=650164 RepID=K5WD46_PHACS|nr:uncharacterized protein PHACADRAFT_203246 [Phanerochaete carnosa HHB-10118-sp]EKM48107.1 hypothetical protein PHACADRAFT_203246 [Phanerochaete carnosa HHB-10118-sp]
MSSASTCTSATGSLSMKLDTIGKLKGFRNYPHWSLMMQQYFIAAHAWKVETTNTYTRFYILSTLGDELLHLANSVDITAAMLWKKLKDNYATSTMMLAFVKFKV